MKSLTVDQIRKSYLDFFKSKNHPIISSDSLVPQNDPTLLFTGAGMNQFKEYFLGLKKDLKRATSSQKCLRTGDLENVGKTPYHHSFFEMLGNFSFGDYFKEEAILWAWEYLTQVLQIPKERLRVSVHHSDSEAFNIWRDKVKIREAWIYKLGDKDNFWPSNAPKEGPNGPCGPCSEIYFDQEDNDAKRNTGSIEEEGGRFAEIWNLVFTQFDRQDGGVLTPLKNKNIDTGMGLERLACVLQGKKTNYEIDIFQSLQKAIEVTLGIKVTEATRSSFYAISDHIRAIVFAMADGVIPSNEGRGYVIRKLIRRSLWHAHQVMPGRELKDAFLYRIVPQVVSVMAVGYPELKDAEASISVTLKGEEERFLDTLETGLRILKEKLQALSKQPRKILAGDIVFELYDTYGFPDELTRVITHGQGFEIDQKGFEELMTKQREQAKKASSIAASIFVTSDLEKKLLALPATKFLGYHGLKSEAKVLMVQLEGGKGIVVLDQSPFYAESGGQVGDRGILTNKKFKAKVVDTQKKNAVILHYVEIESGNLAAGDAIETQVDSSWRFRAMRNHTATHLLHAALRKILGSQVRQLGSLVSPEKLRFDYSYAQPLSAEQILQIEDAVNEEILRDSDVCKEEKPIEEAKKSGAIAFFGEKYGDKVRIVTVPDFSKEFCGGTHCDRTGQIGSFIIVSDSSIASGTRRIEALTGEGALDYIRKMRQQVSKLALDLRTTPDQLSERVKKLQDSAKKLEKQLEQGKRESLDAGKIIESAVLVGDIKFVAFNQKSLEVDQLRHLSDLLRSRSEKIIYLLGTEDDEKIQFLIGMSHVLQKSALDLRQLSQELSPLLGASGGGRKDLIQGGGRNHGQLQTEWSKIVEKSLAYLRGCSGSSEKGK